MARAGVKLTAALAVVGLVAGITYGASNSNPVTIARTNKKPVTTATPIVTPAPEATPAPAVTVTQPLAVVLKPAPKKPFSKPKASPKPLLVQTRTIEEIKPIVYTRDNPPPQGWDATNAPGMGITCQTTTQCLNQAFGGEQAVDAPDTSKSGNYSDCGAMNMPLNPNCWQVIVKPSENTAASFDYYCRYMGTDGGIVDVYRETMLTDDQGLPCKP